MITHNGFLRGSTITSLVLSILLLFTSSNVYAQVAGATLSGTITDVSGAVVPSAEISVKNVGTGIATVAKSDSAGFYTAPNLVPGTYSVTVSAPGFATQLLTGIVLRVGSAQVLDAALTVGQTNQNIEVTGAATVIELSSSSIGGLVEANSVVELPLNGRDWSKLAALQAGVTTLTNQATVSASGVSSRSNRGFGSQVSISGTRPQMNNYRLDGISIEDYTGGPPGSLLGIVLGVDAIAEFSVLTSNYSAEYGRSAGGVVNAITRSGTNAFHGSAFGFLRDEGLDARNYFDNIIPPFHRNQFGGSAGGPIQKDKTFFFGDYEGLRESLGVTNVDLVPSATARTGILSTGNVNVDPIVAQYLGFLPLPNAGLVGAGDTGKFLIATNTNTSENFVTFRIDRKFSEKDSVFGSYFHDSTLQTSPDQLDNWIFGNKSPRQGVALEETHDFSPSLVNSVRGGFSRIVALSDFPISAVNPLSAGTDLGAFPGSTAPNIAVPGIVRATPGLGGLGQSNHWWNSYQVYDDAFLTKGAHLMKFGFAFERMQHNMNISSSPTGNFSFGSLSAFLTNNPKTFLGQAPAMITPRHVRQSLFGGYFQDDWRIRRNITLNLGLRYEVVTVPTEVQGKLSTLPTMTSATPHLGSPLFQNPSLRNFEPRVGFSWAPFGGDKTAVRGAFGIYDILPLNNTFFQQEAQAAPFSVILTANKLPQGSFPSGVVPLLGNDPAKQRSAFIEPNPRRSYVMNWNLNVERQLTSNTSIGVSYVGNHAIHIVNREDDINSVLPTQTSQGLLWPFPAGTGTILNSNVGDIRGVFWNGDAFYDALEAQFTKRMSHNFQVQVAYTWGKSIDTGSATTIGDPYVNSISSLFFFCKTCRRGFSDFNVAQNLTVNYIWDLPTPKILGAVGSNVLGGWELGGIITLQSGLPFTPLIGGDPLGLNSGDPFAFPNRLKGSKCDTAVQSGDPLNYINLSCFTLPVAVPSISAQCSPFDAVPGTCANLLGNASRNSLIGPGIAAWDFSVFKNVHVHRISESFNVQFRAEFFNILNHPNFASPVDNETLFNQDGTPVGGAGAVDATSTTSRQIQLALKLIW